MLGLLNYVREIEDRTIANDACEHLACHSQDGLTIASAIEDLSGVEVPGGHAEGKANLRFIVVNHSHRRYRLRFNSEATQGLLYFSRSSRTKHKFSLTVLARGGGRWPSPHENAVEFCAVNDPVRTQDVLSTTVKAERVLPDAVGAFSAVELRNSVTVGSKGGKPMSRNYLMASAKAVSKLAGPLGAPLEGLISLYDDDRKAERESKLKMLVETGYNLTREVLSEVFEFKEQLERTREIFLDLTAYSLHIRDSNGRPLIGAVREPDAFNPNTAYVTEKSVTRELMDLYRDVDLFKITISQAGFPLGQLNSSTTPKVFFARFLETSRGLNLDLMRNVWQDLAEEMPGSLLLGTVREMYSELSEHEKRKGTK